MFKIEQLYVVQDCKVDTDDQEDPLDKNKQITAETSNIETKEDENTNKRARRVNSGKGVERIEMKFLVKKYDTQFTNTGRKNE